MTNKRKSCRMYSDASAAGNNPRRVQVVMAQFFDRRPPVHCFRVQGAVFSSSISGTGPVVGAHQGPPDLQFRGYFQFPAV